MSVRRFIRFAGFQTHDEVHAYCQRERITDYLVWTGADGIVRGSGELPSTEATNKQIKEPLP